jgi:hypothetical protein
LPVKAEELADGMVSTFEGSFIMIRLLQEPSQLSQQLTNTEIILNCYLWFLAIAMIPGTIVSSRDRAGSFV